MEISRGNGVFGEELTSLFIFRTNINSRPDFTRVKDSLLRQPGIHDCTIDLEDCDKVVRVECENIPMSTIVEEIARHGFSCEELAD